MTTELTILSLGALLLLIHIFAAANAKTKQYGTTWNMGARDEVLPPLNNVAGRLMRAQANYQETFPIAIVALLGVVVAGHAGTLSAAGGWLWLAARIVYLPLYGYGVPKVRTAAFLASLVGLAMVFWKMFVG